MTDVLFADTVLQTRRGVVMTPRPATEVLVRFAAGVIGGRPARVADVGTGSGAIAVAVARVAPRAEVWATDTSAPAVALARLNAWRSGVSDRVHVLDGDLLAPIPGDLDLVLANLPYLPLEELQRYPELAQDPVAAVFASGDGLGPYRRLLAAAEDRLAPQGLLALQLHRRLEVATREQLATLRARVELAAATALRAAA